MNLYKLSILVIVALFLPLAGIGLSTVGQPASDGTVHFDATSPLIIGDYTDPFRYAGQDVRPLAGEASIDVNPSADTGALSMTLTTDEVSGPLVVSASRQLEGRIVILMNRFYGPEEYMQGGIAESLIMHGDSGVMSSLMPQLDAALAGWGGYIDVYADGELVYKDLPAYFMVTDSVRRPADEGYVIRRDSDGVIYSPQLEDKTGFIYSQQLQLHLFASTALPGFETSIDENVAFHLNLSVRDVTAGGGGSVDESTPSTSTPPAVTSDPGTSGGSKGNNGIGNGTDPQPPGNPPPNDAGDKTTGGGKKN
jgi:hypothetical protein